MVELVVKYGTVAVMRTELYLFCGVMSVARPKLMTSVRPEQTTCVPVSHTDLVGDPSFPVSPPWHHRWHCGLRLPHSLLPHRPQPHQRRHLRLQHRQLATTARPVAFPRHPVHPDAYRNGMFGHWYRQARRRAPCTYILSVSPKKEERGAVDPNRYICVHKDDVTTRTDAVDGCLRPFKDQRGCGTWHRCINRRQRVRRGGEGIEITETGW